MRGPGRFRGLVEIGTRSPLTRSLHQSNCESASAECSKCFQYPNNAVCITICLYHSKCSSNDSPSMNQSLRCHGGKWVRRGTLKRVDAIGERRGYRPAVDWISRNLPSQKHNVLGRASRVRIPVRFVLPAIRGPLKFTSARSETEGLSLRLSRLQSRWHA